VRVCAHGVSRTDHLVITRWRITGILGITRS
jgi:hypothetical protein